MLIHPWDAATGPAEWQDWLSSTGRFGMPSAASPRSARSGWTPHNQCFVSG